jgi:hypothetical protein
MLKEEKKFYFLLTFGFILIIFFNFLNIPVSATSVIEYKNCVLYPDHDYTPMQWSAKSGSNKSAMVCDNYLLNNGDSESTYMYRASTGYGWLGFCNMSSSFGEIPISYNNITINSITVYECSKKTGSSVCSIGLSTNIETDEMWINRLLMSSYAYGEYYMDGKFSLELGFIPLNVSDINNLKIYYGANVGVKNQVHVTQTFVFVNWSYNITSDIFTENIPIILISSPVVALYLNVLVFKKRKYQN